MSISGRIVGVTIIDPQLECDTCGTTGIDPQTNWNSCPRCHGSVKGTHVVFLILTNDDGTNKRLRLLNPPSYDSSYYRGLFDVTIWSTGDYIMIGDKLWAKRDGYTSLILEAKVP